MRNTIIVGGLLSLLAIGAVFGFAGITVIEPGEVGLLVKQLGDNRGMQEETLDTGTRWVNPITYDVETYDTRLRQYELAGIPANTADGQPVSVDISFEIGLVDELVPGLHENVGKNYFDQIILPAARSILRNQASNVDSDDIYTGIGRSQIQEAVNSGLVSRLSSQGIRIETNLRDITFLNPEFVATLEEKARAAQQEEIRRREAAAAAQEAIRVQNVAQGQRFRIEEEAAAERERLRLTGEGQRLAEEERAQGILAVAQAEAEGVRLRREALSGEGGAELVSIEWAKNLGPNVKVYGVPTGSPGSSTFMFDDALRGMQSAVAAGAASQ